MKKFLFLIGTLLAATAGAQDYPLTSARPKPLTATVIGVCEKRVPAIMVVIFTFSNGKVLFVDDKNMNGFKDAADIIRYATTAESLYNYAQTCGDATT